MDIEVQQANVKTFAELELSKTFLFNSDLFVKCENDIVQFLSDYGIPSVPKVMEDLWNPTGTVASASSHLTGYEASKAIDSNRLTSWLTEITSDPKWFQLDFISSQEVDQLIIYDANGNIQDWIIQYWTGSAWQTIIQGTGIEDGSEILFPTPVTTTKIRITINSTVNLGLCGIREIGIKPEKYIIPSGSTILASNEVAGHEASYAIDNDFVTYWEGDILSAPLTLEVTFLSEEDIDGVILWEEFSNIDDLDLEYWDGSSWQILATGEVGPFDETLISFTKVTTTKIKVTINSTSDSLNPGLNEIHFHRALADDPVIPDLSSFITVSNAFNLSKNESVYFLPEDIVEQVDAKIIKYYPSSGTFG